MVNLAQQAHNALVPLDPDDGATDNLVDNAAARWRIDLDEVVAADPEATEPTTADRRVCDRPLADRLSAARLSPRAQASPIRQFINQVKRAIRDVAGRVDLPVLLIVSRVAPGLR